MNEEQEYQDQPAGGERRRQYRRRRCEFGNDEAWDHFRAARIEFLKGVRELLTDTIDRMDARQQKGTKVTVD